MSLERKLIRGEDGIIHSPYPFNPPPELCIWDYILGSITDEDRTVAVQDHPTNPAPSAQESSSITYAQLKQRATRLGLGLQSELGLKKGDMVMIAGPNSIRWLIVMYACQFAGLKITLVNPGYLDHELGHTLTLTEPKFVFHEGALLPRFTANQWPLDRLVAINAPPSGGANGAVGAHSVDAISSKITEEAVKTAKNSPPDSVDEVAFLCFSSGTTGLPKAVQITHRNSASMLQVLNSIPPSVGVDRIADKHGDRRLWEGKPFSGVVFLPFFHAFGLQTGALLSLKNRGTMHLCSPFTPDKFVSIIREQRVEYAGLSPPLVAALNTAPEEKVSKDMFKSIRWSICGGAALDAANQVRCEEKLDMPILQGWGMSELSVANAGFAHGQTPGAVGWLMPGVKARIVDEKMNDVPVDTPGELLISSPTVMKGYYRNEKATADTFAEPGHWLRTGDLVKVQADGQLWIVDRIKEVIKVGNYQVPPAELEGILKTHPKVKLAAVVGILNKQTMQEMPRAYIELIPSFAEQKESYPAFIKELDEFLSSQTIEYKHLTGGIKIIPQVPVSATGKVVRKEIRKMAQEDPDISAK